MSVELDLISRGLLLVARGRAFDKRWEFDGHKGAFLLAQEERYDQDMKQWESDARALILKQGDKL